AAATELIAFLDSDTVPHGDWISPLAAHLQDPLVGAAAPRIVALQRDGLGAVRNALDLGGEPASVRPYGPVGHVPTAALLIRRSPARRPAGDRGGRVRRRRPGAPPGGHAGRPSAPPCPAGHAAWRGPDLAGRRPLRNPVRHTTSAGRDTDRPPAPSRRGCLAA